MAVSLPKYGIDSKPDLRLRGETAYRFFLCFRFFFFFFFSPWFAFPPLSQWPVHRPSTQWEHGIRHSPLAPVIVAYRLFSASPAHRSGGLSSI